VVVVPAHDEKKGIIGNLDSLLMQTVKVDILVVSDKSTDGTVELVQDYITSRKLDNIRIIETVGNDHKKAGALNQAIRFLIKEGVLRNYAYVLCMDADTVLKYDLVEQALIEFGLNPRLGAVCSRAGVIKQQPKGFLSKLVYHLQYTEYAEFDRSRVFNRHIKVAHGMCSVFKVEALLKVMEYRRTTKNTKECMVYNVHNITEDYELTVTLKRLGYEIATGLGMYAWTDVPEKWGELWKQRIRWLRGGLDTLKEHGWCKATRWDIVNSYFFWVMFLIQSALAYSMFLSIYHGYFMISNSLLLVMGIMYIDNLHVLRYVQKPTKWDILVRVIFLPQLIYAWFAILQQLYSYYLYMFKPNQEW
jgi:biofilm PGA synthesis N-glycosyltransferase PgaC